MRRAGRYLPDLSMDSAYLTPYVKDYRNVSIASIFIDERCATRNRHITKRRGRGWSSGLFPPILDSRPMIDRPKESLTL